MCREVDLQRESREERTTRLNYIDSSVGGGRSQRQLHHTQVSGRWNEKRQRDADYKGQEAGRDRGSVQVSRKYNVGETILWFYGVMSLNNSREQQQLVSERI